MPTITLIYENDFTKNKTTVTKHAGETFDEVYQALYEACLAIGFSAETVKECFEPDEFEDRFQVY